MFDELLPRLALNAALAGNEDIEVADSFASATQRSGRRNFFDPRNSQQVLHEFFRQFFGSVEQKSSGNAAIILNRFQQLRFLLFTHTRQRADLAFARQLLHALEIADLISAPDQGDGLRSESLNLEQL